VRCELDLPGRGFGSFAAGAGFAGARSLTQLVSARPGKVEPPKAATFPG
jgi:hypothetical protein